MADYDLCGMRCLDLFPCARSRWCGNDTKTVRPVSRRWYRTFPSVVAFADRCTCLHPLAQFSPMVCRIMATMACPSLRGGLRVHFCSRPLICSAALHAVHLFSVLNL